MTTSRLSDFIASLAYHDLTPRSVEVAKEVLLDSLGCAAEGSAAPWVEPVRSLVMGMGGRPEASLWFSEFRGPCSNIPLVTGTMVHAYWLDDVHSKLHPAAVVIPAALAVSERVGVVSGKRLLTAVVAGYEATVRIAKAADIVAMRLKGWQPASVCGGFGAAAAAAKILGLEPHALSDALGLAGSQAAGTYAFEADASTAEKLHMGWAAQRGVVAALLAEKGTWNSRQALEAPDGGFCKLFKQEADLGLLTRDLGLTFEVENTSIKLYPVCGSLVAYVDVASALHRKYSLNPDRIKKVTARVARVVELQCGGPYRELGVLHAAGNLAFCVATGLAAGTFSTEHLTPAWMGNERIIELSKKVETVLDAGLDRDYPAKCGAALEVETDKGEVFSLRIAGASGSAENPVTWEAVTTKFKGQSKNRVAAAKAERVIQTIEHLEEVGDVGQLIELIQGGEDAHAHNR